MLRKRKKYDKYGKDWQHADAYEAAEKRQAASGGFGGGFRRGTAQNTGDFSQNEYSDFFESMFGGGASSSSRGSNSRTRQFKGQDVRASLRLNLTDTLQDQKQTIDIGSKKIRLTIPAGVEDGQTIKIKNQGGEGANAGPRGDLYLSFEVLNNTAFVRAGDDLYKTVEIDLYTALLGGEILVDTLSGSVKLKVKPETQGQTKVKLTGKGMPKYKKDTQFGNLIITYKIKLTYTTD